MNKKTVFSQPNFILNPARTSLIVVDMQNDFLRKGGALYVPNARKTIRNHQKLIQSCRERGIPIFFTRYITPPAPTLWKEYARSFTDPPVSGCCKGLMRYFPEIRKKLDATEIIQEIYPEAGDYVIEKGWFDSFWATPLESYLRAHDIEFVIITGTVTEVCIEATAKGAYFRNFRTVVVSDAVSSATPRYHRLVLELLAKRWARVIKTSEVLIELKANGSISGGDETRRHRDRRSVGMRPPGR
jgi:nicotinamidase-related amidase